MEFDTCIGAARKGPAAALGFKKSMRPKPCAGEGGSSPCRGVEVTEGIGGEGGTVVDALPESGAWGEQSESGLVHGSLSEVLSPLDTFRLKNDLSLLYMPQTLSFFLVPPATSYQTRLVSWIGAQFTRDVSEQHSPTLPSDRAKMA